MLQSDKGEQRFHNRAEASVRAPPSGATPNASAGVLEQLMKSKGGDDSQYDVQRLKSFQSN